MAGVGTADEPAASGTSDRAAVPSGVSTGIYMVSEMRDGDKSKLRDEGMMKDVVDIVDIIAHKLLGTDVWEQPEIDEFPVETPDGSKYEWLLVQSKLQRQRNSCHFDDSLPCRCCEERGASLHVHLESLQTSS